MRFSQTGGWTLGPPVYLNINKTEGAEKERREARSLRKEDDSPDNSDETSERLLNDFHRRFGQKFRIQHWGFVADDCTDRHIRWNSVFLTRGLTCHIIDFFCGSRDDLKMFQRSLWRSLPRLLCPVSVVIVSCWVSEASSAAEVTFMSDSRFKLLSWKSQVDKPGSVPVLHKPRVTTQEQTPLAVSCNLCGHLNVTRTRTCC